MAAGELDPTFSGDGLARYGPPLAYFNDVAVEPGGKILALGSAPGPDGRTDILLTRLLEDGTPDASFGPAGSGGQVITDVGAANSGGSAIERMPDGRIVIAGSRDDGPMVVLRFLPDGAADPSFGAGGKVVLSPRADLRVNDMALQPDGSIVLAGGSGNYFTEGGKFDSMLARLMPDGAPDPTFGAGGYVFQDLARLDTFSGIAIDSHGRLLTAAHGSDMDLFVLRFSATGAPDPTFGDGGRALLSSQSLGVGDVLALPGDEVLVSYLGGGHALVKLKEDGTPDPSFGEGGFAHSGVGSAILDWDVSELALQPDGKIILAGAGYTDPVPDPREEGDTVRLTRFLVMRFDAAGHLDPGYNGGVILVNPDADPAHVWDPHFARAVALDAEGRAVIAGYSWVYAPEVIRLRGGPPTRAPVTLGPDGTLEVLGTASPDSISLEGVESPEGPLVRAVVNGDVSDFPAADVARVVVDGRGMSDSVSARPSLGKPLHVAGADPVTVEFLTVYGTEGADVASTGIGQATVGDFHVTVEGLQFLTLDLLGGDDVANIPADGMYATVHGRDGNDTLTMSLSRARFDGGAGDDTVVLNGDDTYQAATVYLGPGGGGDADDEYGGRIDSDEDSGFAGALDYNRVERLVLNLMGDADSVYVASHSRTTVSVDGGDGQDALVVDDADNDGPTDYVLRPFALRRLAAAENGAAGSAAGDIGFGWLEHFTLICGPGPSDVTVTPSEQIRFTINGGDADPSGPPILDRLHFGPSGASEISLTTGDPGSGTYTFFNQLPIDFSGIEVLPSAVVGRHVFYGRETFGGGSFDPENFIAPDKQALLPGRRATFANITSYTRGMNGIAIDVVHLGPAALDAIKAALGLKVGTGGDPAAWPSAPPPVIRLRPGSGERGSDRILIQWRDGAIQNSWVEVTVPAIDSGGAWSREVFYFGNLVGETGDRTSPLRVNSGDLARVLLNRSAPGETVSLTNRYDFNRDGKVNSLDVATVRRNFFHSLRPIESPWVAVAAARPLWDELDPDLLRRASAFGI